MAWIELNATNPAPPAGAQNVHFREDSTHLGTATDPTPVSAYVGPFVGDAGAGGASGLVPAPAAGDAAAGKVLKADGTWYVPPDATASGVQQEAYTFAVDSGTANAYSVSLTPVPALVAGSKVVFKAANANTGAATLAVNGGAAIPITKRGSTALAADDIAAGQIIGVVYDGANFQLISGGAAATAAAIDLQTGGVDNANQSKLNLIAGTNVTLTADGAGGVTVAASGSSGASGWTATVPSGPTSAGTAGQYSSDGAHAYLCYATNMWGKFPMSPLFENPPVTDGLLLYYDANMYSFTDGTSVAEISDLTGDEHNALAQSTGAVFHTGQINGRAALQFAGTSAGRYTLGNGFFSPNITVFVVAKAAVSAILYFLSGNAGALEWRFTNSGSGVSPQLAKANTASIGVSTAVIPLNTFAQWNVTLSSSGDWAFRVAQASAGGGTYSGAMPTVSTSVLGYFGASGGFDYNGEMAEVIVYDRVLTSAEIATVEAWLFGKYGV